MPLDALTAHRPPTRDYHGREAESVTVGGVGLKRAADGCAVSTYWTLGFKQSSFNLIAQASRGDSIHAFRRPPLHQHALVPFTFRLQVSWFASESVPELRPIYSGIHSVRTTAHTLMASGSTGRHRSGWYTPSYESASAPLARLVRPGLPLTRGVVRAA
jgi:hypothetical protein